MNYNSKLTLQDWWADTASGDSEKVVPKAIEYGAGDLEEIGRTMAKITGLEDLSEAQATELGIYFYVVGKMARWTSAIERGELASDDTLLDLTTYLMMARRNRDVGGWPWAKDADEGLDLDYGLADSSDLNDMEDEL